MEQLAAYLSCYLYYYYYYGYQQKNGFGSYHI